jgi:hypothetical protein
LPFSLPSWLVPFWLPFAYSPYRCEIDAATYSGAANEGIDFMKFGVKKNQRMRALFLNRIPHYAVAQRGDQKKLQTK